MIWNTNSKNRYNASSGRCRNARGLIFLYLDSRLKNTERIFRGVIMALLETFLDYFVAPWDDTQEGLNKASSRDSSYPFTAIDDSTAKRCGEWVSTTNENGSQSMGVLDLQICAERILNVAALKTGICRRVWRLTLDSFTRCRIPASLRWALRRESVYAHRGFHKAPCDRVRESRFHSCIGNSGQVTHAARNRVIFR